MAPELFLTPTVIITALSLVTAAIILVYSFTSWRQHNMMYFALLVLAVFINVLGYFLEVTSTTLEAAVVACKVAYLGIPLTGILFYNFSRVFSDKPRLKPLVSAALFLPAPIFTLSVFAYPWLPLFYQELAYGTETTVNHLIVTPGPLYYLCFLYGIVFSALAFANLMISFIRQRRYEGAAIFFIAITIPLAAQLDTMIFGLIDGWNPLRSSLTLSVGLLAIYLARYKKAEWLSVGRELVVQDMDDAFILLNNKGMVIDHNISAESYFPELKEGDWVHRLHDLWEFPQENYLQYDVHQFGFMKGDQALQLKVTTSPLVANGKVTGILVVINDDTATYRMIQELTRMARIDDLTGLRNRSTFFSDAALFYNLADRREENMGCALMMDIDFFKSVNDTYGHYVGDLVLAYIGELIRSRFRQTDICGRYGGEELCVWMPATVIEGAYLVAEEMRAAVEAKQFTCGGTTFNVTISIGISCMRDTKARDFDDLIKQADQALYLAKNTGRNRTCIYKEPE